MQCDSVLKKKEILPYATTWMKLEDVRLISVDFVIICLWSLLKYTSDKDK